MNDIAYRFAGKDDANFLAKIIREVSAGVVDALLHDLLPTVGPEKILSMVLGDTSTHYSHQNCLLAEQGIERVGLLFAYDASLQTIPKLMKTMLPAKRLEPLSDLLLAHVPETLYINTFWVASEQRGQGVAKELLLFAKKWAEQLGLKGLSLFAFRHNLRATAFYAHHGFKVVREVVVPEKLQQQNGAGDLWHLEF
ncbi:MAG: GNAT family N-acetyltransferase [Desulfovibrio sp.]|nr:GNAT family N-acetyltransferase [Desulfovibrio sp.]